MATPAPAQAAYSHVDTCYGNIYGQGGLAGASFWNAVYFFDASWGSYQWHWSGPVINGQTYGWVRQYYARYSDRELYCQGAWVAQPNDTGDPAYRTRCVYIGRVYDDVLVHSRWRICERDTYPPPSYL